MHNSPSTDAAKKKKPLVVQLYNQNKAGVDGVDQMAKKYTTRAATRQWPLALSTNLLDIAALTVGFCTENVPVVSSENKTS